MKWIENQKNTVKKLLGFCWNLCVIVSVWVYACVGYSCVLMCVCVSVPSLTLAHTHIDMQL